ncbi:MAG TPA: magnesium-translocating P-type ATPase [Kofleriaceae bacterium]|nr:magnesium-translocating P-type ATPase [Kofleriaceae bacterium]
MVQKRRRMETFASSAPAAAADSPQKLRESGERGHGRARKRGQRRGRRGEGAAASGQQAAPAAYWASEPERVAAELGTGLGGLTTDEAARRLERVGTNEIHPRRALSWVRLLWRQVRSPLVLLLVFAACASTATGEWADAAIVAAILVASVGVGFHREHHAETAIAALLERIEIAASVVRDGAARAVPAREVVPGDVVELEAGSIVPADGVLVEANGLHVDEAMLTGESFPVSKRVGRVDAAAGLGARKGCVHSGTTVRSGTARALIVATGAATAYGAIAGRLAAQEPETEFERGLRRFGMLLLVTMLVLVIVVLAVNVLLGRPLIETLLFSIALAVGLSPELLPAIVGVNLARGARMLARDGMLVRRLDAIENLGSMDVLCTDKTGTLTEGVARVEGAYDPDGGRSEAVMELAALNATLHTGLANPIDAALALARTPDLTGIRTLGEIPYDFSRKRLGVVIERAGAATLVVKGAVARVLDVCTRLRGGVAIDGEVRAGLEARARAWAEQGIRVIAVATRQVDARGEHGAYGIDDERELELAGFVTIVDRPKPDARGALARIAALGVRVKMITGDSRPVACHVAAAVGLGAERVMTGAEIDRLSELALVEAVDGADVFAEVDPDHKERILRALRRRGAVVGFFGDGVNDAPAMHAADVSISVDSAVDVAKATADLVMTSRGLDLILRGIEEGRRTFANTLKYVLTTTSANLGNMISMAVASLVLPFLPMTAGQILLNNFLSDIPAVGIANDRVDRELVAVPRRWDLRFVGRFMLEFGVLSSAFDALTFATLYFGFGASPELFRTGWFVESLLTELAIALVVRTRRRAWHSAPGRLLVWTSAAVAAFAFALPYLPVGPWLGLTPPPPGILLAITGIAAAYVLASEQAKVWFYRPPRPGEPRRRERAIAGT